MAQLNITLNQEEILQLLCNDRDEAFKKLLQDSLDSVLKAESAEQLGADPYERTEDRTDSRNGFRDRDLATRIGSIRLHVPRHRNVPFKTMIFENYSRSESALIAGMAEMVVNGVSTRRVSRVMETLCGTSYSKSTVSELCRDLEKDVNEFRNRPLTDIYPFLCVDATYFKVREHGRSISKAFMIAYGVNSKGLREVLGFNIYANESKDTWKDFFTSLKKRGLHGVLMITSDAHEGIRDGICKVFPEASWQRCQFHFSKDIADKAPKKYQTGLHSELSEMFNSKTVEEARIKRDSIIEEYKDVAEKAMNCLDEGFEDSMTAMVLPNYLRRYFRTSNHIERLNRELKRRSKVIGVFPNEMSLLRLIGSVLIESNELMQNKQSFFGQKALEKILASNVPQQMIAIASAQRMEIA